ncbi:MAG: DEAD/DEAH box helicase, partial [Acidobacteria bacterium]|nr:DEAD/DEAH box helicase [Acidobacteriota bacterium]
SKGWPAIAAGDSTLILAPTGSGKTLTAFLWCINRVMFEPPPETKRRCRVVYISPLKALAVDIERNLRAPLAGIAHRAAARGDRFHPPVISIRTGDTPAVERARFMREPADILITTPESLYLLLTSNARDALRAVDTVIVDEIHALVPTKRGAHLALSLERLQALRDGDRSIQRIGLSATQRPLDEVARFLGGTYAQGPKGLPPEALAKAGAEGAGAIHDEFSTQGGVTPRYRPVTIVDTSEKKKLELRIEVPVEDMAKIGQAEEIPSGPASQGPKRTSIWTAIHPRLLELIRAHRSTLIFVNSRRIAERLAAALNELAGEVLVRSHHGSLARPQRIEVEDGLKAGHIRGLVATSSLELGIDMGAIDLVVQIEAPPSVASGMQRIGRAGHTIGAASRGVIVPKYRGDLIACAAVARAMHEARVESSRYPRNPLDVLAQQIVAMVSMDPWNVEELFSTLRSAAPFAELSRSVFEGVLDMLSGRYPSDDFADLRPRITWDRLNGTLTAREGAKRVAVINGGTIPDRGLYGVFLVGERGPGARVGELDEEMVFESRVGETFLLGASTWRIEEITHDRVLVSPAPGEPGKMPFWKADAAGRPLELGRHIGELIRTLRALPAGAALTRLVTHHDLDQQAAENLLRYLNDQVVAAGAAPDDRTILIERTRDELGDWRICVLSPFGGRIHAPWAMAVVERARAHADLDVETMWADDGFVVRFPETEEPPDPALMVPSSEEVEALVLRQLGGTALFAAKFREAAARALLLPKRRPGGRSPLWQQRKRAADLLAVASRFGSFPMLLETYRECLRDVFDMPALVDTLRRIEQRQIKTVTVDSTIPSPFASSLLFAYVANYIYDGDAPLAERRAQALSIDQAQLRELLGDVELRELLDADALAEVEAQVQQLDPAYHARSVDGVHDLLLHLGDLTPAEIAARGRVDATMAIEELGRARRIITVNIAGQSRVLPVEYAGRYRDALGVPLPPGLPDSLLQPSPTAGSDLARRYARTHGPFTTAEFAARYGLGHATADGLLKDLHSAGRLLEGEFRPGGSGREWCDPEILQSVRRRSLARLRKQVEPVEPHVFVRLLTSWQGLVRRRSGLDALLDAIEHLQGVPLPATVFESEILAARVANYQPSDLDALCAAGEVVWRGVEPLGDRDGRLALYLTDHFGRLAGPADPGTLLRQGCGGQAQGPESFSDRERAIVEHLGSVGASFFGAIHDATGGGYPGETVEAIWNLVWKGVVTNDTFHALRAFTRAPERRARKVKTAGRSFRSRRASPPSAEGRWSLVSDRIGARVSLTEWSAAVAQQLLSRYGVLTREVAGAEGIYGGFSAVYKVLKAMEDAGRIRRGYFVAEVGATQFALPAALELMRSLRENPDEPETIVLSATDPANPYGTMLKWPGLVRGEGPVDGSVSAEGVGRGATRTVGSQVIFVNGVLAAYIPRGGRQLLAYAPDDEPERSAIARPLSTRLASIARGEDGRAGLMISEINGVPAAEHLLAPFLLDAGFYASAMGLMVRRLATPDRSSLIADYEDRSSIANRGSQ